MSPQSRAKTDARTDARTDVEPLEVRVYRFTGWQAFFKVPDSWCRECDMFARAADQGAQDFTDETGIPVEVRVLPWWLRMLGVLRFGGWYPPLMVVEGTLLCQGYDVPSSPRVQAALARAARDERGIGLDIEAFEAMIPDEELAVKDHRERSGGPHGAGPGRDAADPGGSKG